MLLGAHQSIASGLHNAYGFAAEDGCEAIQIFTKNASQWKEPTHTPDQIARFRDARLSSSFGQSLVLSHDSYLINLCAVDEAMRARSRESLLAEALRCEAFGIDCIVLHPGAHLGVGLQGGIEGTIESLTWVLAQSRGAKVQLLVENTAGQGSVVGSRFEELGAILRGCDEVEGADAKNRMGVCIDTCHAFAAGYDISQEAGFDAAWSALDEHVGIGRIRAMHLNDSQKGLGCRLDRHQRIGEGELGLYPFWRLQNDLALASVVAVLETPNVGKDRAFKQQLETMRGYVGAPAPVPPKKELMLEAQDKPAAPSRRRASKVTTRSAP
ncbi:MAG: deoxyribonuclease IV [Polyangiales bacterium]